MEGDARVLVLMWVGGGVVRGVCVYVRVWWRGGWGWGLALRSGGSQLRLDTSRSLFSSVGRACAS